MFIVYSTKGSVHKKAQATHSRRPASIAAEGPIAMPAAKLSGPFAAIDIGYLE